MVNVYDTTGEFRYGIQISTIKNGQGGIATLDGRLYINSRCPVIFVFQDDQIIECIDPYNSYEKYLSTIKIFSSENNTMDKESNYRLLESTNDIIKLDTKEVIIDLPEKSHMAKFLLITGLLVLFLSVYGFEKLFARQGDGSLVPSHTDEKDPK